MPSLHCGVCILCIKIIIIVLCLKKKKRLQKFPNAWRREEGRVALWTQRSASTVTGAPARLLPGASWDPDSLPSP